MESRPHQPDAIDPAVDPDERLVTAHETRPGRTVFTEVDNCDGWIATDLAVEPER